MDRPLFAPSGTTKGAEFSGWSILVHIGGNAVGKFSWPPVGSDSWSSLWAAEAHAEFSDQSSSVMTVFCDSMHILLVI